MKSLSLRLIEIGAWCYLSFLLAMLIFTLSSGTPLNNMRIGYGDDGYFKYFWFAEEGLEANEDGAFLSETEIERARTLSHTINYSNPNIIKLVSSVYWLGIIFLTYLIIRSIRTIYSNGLFHQGILRSLNTLVVGFLSLILYKNLIVPMIVSAYLNQASRVTIGLDGQSILWILLLVFLVSAIKEGIDLKTENDLTI